jgi:hypothetical protein
VRCASEEHCATAVGEQVLGFEHRCIGGLVQEVLRCLCTCRVKLKIPSTFFHGCVLLQKSNEEPELSLQLRSASAFAASSSPYSSPTNQTRVSVA